MNRHTGTMLRPKHRCDGNRRCLIPALILLTIVFFTSTVSAMAMTDEGIEEALNTRLMNDNAVQAHMIDVEVNKGVVTLSGTVNRLMASERAVGIAMTVKGVKAVVNSIETSTGSRSDQQILQDVHRALNIDPVADADEIDVEVRDAEVFLTGRVDSWQEKNLVALAVKGVKGVRGVKNNLEVNASPRRPDEEIASEIRKRLFWDAWIEADNVDVKVDNGRVRLSGVVGSLSEKKRVMTKAWISGVRAMDAEELTVDWETHRRNLRSKPRKNYPDQEVKEAIDSALANDPRVSHKNIDVRVENGIVTLDGTVSVLSAAEAARQDAENTVGVWMVKNLIKVRPALTPAYAPLLDTDIEVAERVRLALALSAETDQQNITVTVNNHLVMLDGTVDSKFARKRAAEVASQVRGVATLVNNLNVAAGRSKAMQEDWRIRKDIQDELHWSPFVDESRVNVMVEDGTAVLTGVVADLKARRAATANARDAGAVRVKNRLKVRNGPDFLQP